MVSEAGKVVLFSIPKIGTLVGLMCPSVFADKIGDFSIFQVVNLRKEGENLDFLGFTLRYDRDLHGRPHRYLNVFPSDKAMKRIRERIHERTCSGYKRSLRTTIQHINDLTRGWKNYFQIGYPRKRFRDINWYILKRIEVFLRHRSQRKCKPLMDGESLYAGLRRMGLVPL